jgi:pyruvate dehydrogenase E1 component beta subunit
VINAAAKINSMSNGQYLAPMVFRGPTGSAGQLAQQHSQNFENWYANTPGLKVVVPSNPADAKGLLKSAIRDENPVIFMESEQMYGFKGMIPEGEYTIPIGVADVVKEGSDVTIVSFGKMMLRAHTAVEELAKEGINAELIDLRTVRPIDYDTVIRSVQKTNRLVIVEEAWPLASISSELSHIVQRRAFDYLDAPVHRVTSMDTNLPYAGVFVDAYLPSVERIVKAAKEVTYKG